MCIVDARARPNRSAAIAAIADEPAEMRERLALKLEALAEEIGALDIGRCHSLLDVAALLRRAA